MRSIDLSFGEDLMHDLKHYLSSQSPLKDFIHHTTLHTFQHDNFHAGLQKASEIVGYQVYLSLNEFRELVVTEKINVI